MSRLVSSPLLSSRLVPSPLLSSSRLVSSSPLCSSPPLVSSPPLLLSSRLVSSHLSPPDLLSSRLLLSSSRLVSSPLSSSLPHSGPHTLEVEPAKEEASATARWSTYSCPWHILRRILINPKKKPYDGTDIVIVLAIDRHCYSVLTIQCIDKTSQVAQISPSSLCRLLVWCAPKGTWPPNTGLACGEGQSATAGSLDSRVLVGGAACLMCQGGQVALDQRRVARRCSFAAHSALALTVPHAECTEPPHTARLTGPS